MQFRKPSTLALRPFRENIPHDLAIEVPWDLRHEGDSASQLLEVTQERFDVVNDVLLCTSVRPASLDDVCSGELVSIL